ncbi:ATP-binding cassette domain-containing protein, partial [Actinomyces sp. MRS3W]|uniref:ATP-binding cassette domain-containing protein n=1 Tax=Actinomyces sp. MRS3W TaxID=2800796 RepID=UPI0028FD4CEE
MTIVLSRLGVHLGSRALVDGVDLRLEPGERTALIGASGAGKSMTCAAIAGTLMPDATVTGSLHIEDESAGAEGTPATAPSLDASDSVQTDDAPTFPRRNLLHLPAPSRGHLRTHRQQGVQRGGGVLLDEGDAGVGAAAVH